MDNNLSIFPNQYIETGGSLPDSGLLREIIYTHNLLLKISENQRFWEKGVQPPYNLNKETRCFYSETGRLAIKFKTSLIFRSKEIMN